MKRTFTAKPIKASTEEQSEGMYGGFSGKQSEENFVSIQQVLVGSILYVN